MDVCLQGWLIKMVKGMRTIPDKDYFCNSASKNDIEIIPKSFDKAIIALRISIRKLATIIESLDDKRMFYVHLDGA